MGRISIASLLGLVVVFALGLAALVNANEIWAGAMLLVTLAALLGGVLGLILRGWRGGGWLGFAVFGWGYFVLGSIPWLADELRSLSDEPIVWAFERSHRPDPIPPPPPLSESPPALEATILPPRLPPDPVDPPEVDHPPRFPRRHVWNTLAATRISHRLATLGFGGLGAIVGVLLARRGPDTPPADRPA